MKLSDYLESSKLTQQQFADSLGVTQGMVQHWLAGRTPVSPSKAVRIEQITNGSVTRRDLRPNDWNLIWPEIVAA